MTRKDYELIQLAFIEQMAVSSNTDNQTAIAMLACRLAKKIKEKDDKFDNQKFLKPILGV